MLCSECIINLPGKEYVIEDEVQYCEPPSCPLCRALLPTNMVQFLYGTAVKHVSIARKFPLDSHKRKSHGFTARHLMEKVITVISLRHRNLVYL